MPRLTDSFYYLHFKTAAVAKQVSDDWKALPAQERSVWEEMARKDRARYDSEMLRYAEAMKRSASSISGVVGASLPKRPMSAYLAFSNQRRAKLKAEHPDATNAELSKMLSQAWKDAPTDVRNMYIAEEARLRAQYNVDMVPWRNKKKVKKNIRKAPPPVGDSCNDEATERDHEERFGATSERGIDPILRAQRMTLVSNSAEAKSVENARSTQQQNPVQMMQSQGIDAWRQQRHAQLVRHAGLADVAQGMGSAIDRSRVSALAGRGFVGNLGTGRIGPLAHVEPSYMQQVVDFRHIYQPVQVSVPRLQALPVMSVSPQQAWITSQPLMIDRGIGLFSPDMSGLTRPRSLGRTHLYYDPISQQSSLVTLVPQSALPRSATQDRSLQRFDDPRTSGR